MTQPHGAIVIRPVEGENHKGRQWGYAIERDGTPLARAWTIGRGPGWGVLWAGDEADKAVVGDEAMHIRDLDEVIAVLTALRDSDAHRQNVAWRA